MTISLFALAQPLRLKTTEFPLGELSEFSGLGSVVNVRSIDVGGLSMLTPVQSGLFKSLKRNFPYLGRASIVILALAVIVTSELSASIIRSHAPSAIPSMEVSSFFRPGDIERSTPAALCTIARKPRRPIPVRIQDRRCGKPGDSGRKPFPVLRISQLAECNFAASGMCRHLPVQNVQLAFDREFLNHFRHRGQSAGDWCDEKRTHSALTGCPRISQWGFHHCHTANM